MPQLVSRQISLMTNPFEVERAGIIKKLVFEL
jgi:hypothetical protein